jgi:hypothetical protein
VKTATANMQTHLAQQVTSLATLWRVTRVDGNVFGFTDHDRDITYDSTTFEAATGYARSAVAHRSDMSVSELELEGLLDEVRDILDANLLNSDNITDVDLRNGKFDGSVVEIFVVNWADLTQGSVKILKGNIGKVVLRDGIYTAELRGLLHRYQRTIGELTSPGCRADLFDTRCTLDPDDWREENRVASATDRRVFVYSGTVAAGGASSVTVDNPGAEDGALGDWEQAEDTATTMAALASLGAVSPRTGSYLFGTTTSDVDCGLQQTLDATIWGVSASDIDEGRFSATLAAWHKADEADRLAQLRIDCLDYLDTLIIRLESDPVSISTSTWTQETFSASLPIGTRSIRIGIIGIRDEVSGNLDVCFDDVTLSLQDLGDTDLTETGDYYDGGHLEWLSGGNQALSMEIKTVNVGTNTINLFLPMPWTIEAWHRFAIFPGCQKRYDDDCRDKFDNILNFRGEPYLPGQDLLFRFPDAQ